ncbi:MAG: sigma 54-interacting transcriptional regulator [Spirochaetales bacterium]|jgi:transcriptional regulator with PAS, ATPase and Fis domain|nr:sigma 54-interacting transcriptional regulator [Spirochaetales bacterium]
MIKILFYTPYKEIEIRILDILKAYTVEEKIEPHFFLCNNSEEIKTSPVEMDYDAIVARGMTAAILRGKSDMSIPVIELLVSGSDIVRTIQKCREMYQCHKIAVVGPLTMSYAAKVMAALSTFPIEVYYLQNRSDINSIIFDALQSGCDAVIGGTTAIDYAASMGLPAVMIENSDESLWNAIKEAVHSVHLQRREREQAEFLNVVMDNYKEGIVVVDAKENIQFINDFAAKTIDVQVGACLGKNAMVWFYDLKDAITDAFAEGRTTHTQLFVRKGHSYSTTIIPIVMREQTISVILCFDDVRSIQKNEQQIRNKLYNKGMVAGYTFNDIVHKSADMADLIAKAKRFAVVESNILITGETGVGKELFAQSIHNHSKRQNAPFVAVNCAALPEHLLESELFGYSEGAFTGASKGGKQGLFELAHNGTLFLDEIGEIPLPLQSKLLRVLQEKNIRRIGDNRVIPVNTRIIAATNKNLHELSRRNLFRQDLYYRLDVLELNIMPLREHPDDIVPLFETFLSRLLPQMVKQPVLTSEAAALLRSCPWEGNIRELQNIAERVLVLNEKDFIDVQTLRLIVPEATALPPASGSLSAFAPNPEIERIMNALRQTHSREAAAKQLGISRATLWRKIREYGI